MRPRHPGPRPGRPGRPGDRPVRRARDRGGLIPGSWDLVVVGAGPAGAATALGALRARPEARVLLLDRAEFPRDKACGDGLAPHVLDLLASVGVRPADVVGDQTPVQRLRLAHEAGAEVVRRMRRPAYVVPRLVLDARMVAAAVAAGAVLERRRVRRVEAGADQVVVDGGIAARVVVGADGPHSVVRAAVLPRDDPGRRSLAIRGYAPVGGARRRRQEIVLSRGRRPAYAWSFDIGDGRANVGYGEVLDPGGHGPGRADLLRALDRLLPGAGDGGTHWRAAHLPLTPVRPRLAAGGVLLVGDAARLVNPLTGEGIYYAVASGLLAGRAAVTAADPAQAYADAVRRSLSRHLRHTWLAGTAIGLPGVGLAGVRAAAAGQDVFDDLVEVGLADGLLRPRTLAALALHR